MGKFSRRKGNRVEYLVRDAMREHGFQVDRIPASGAAQGFKGDLRARHQDKEYTVEVKARKDEFNHLYEILDTYTTHGWGYKYTYDGGHIVLGDNPFQVIALDRGLHLEFDKKLETLFKNCRKYLVNCDLLAIKQDRKPVIYMRWIDA